MEENELLSNYGYFDPTVFSVDHQFLSSLSGIYHGTFNKITFLPHFDARLELQQVILNMPTYLNAFSFCHVIG